MVIGTFLTICRLGHVRVGDASVKVPIIIGSSNKECMGPFQVIFFALCFRAENKFHHHISNCADGRNI